MIRPHEVEEPFSSRCRSAAYPGVGKVMDGKLAELGIRSVGDLRQHELMGGAALRALRARALPRWRAASTTARSIRISRRSRYPPRDTFESDVLLTKLAALHVQRMAEKAWQGVTARSRRPGRTVVLKLKTSDFPYADRGGLTPPLPPATPRYSLHRDRESLLERSWGLADQRYRLIGVGLDNFDVAEERKLAGPVRKQKKGTPKPKKKQTERAQAARIPLADLLVERQEVAKDAQPQQAHGEQIDQAGDPLAHVETMHAEDAEKSQQQPAGGVVDAAFAVFAIGVAIHAGDQEQVDDPADEEQAHSEEPDHAGDLAAVIVETVCAHETKDPQHIADMPDVRVVGSCRLVAASSGLSTNRNGSASRKKIPERTAPGRVKVIPTRVLAQPQKAP